MSELNPIKLPEVSCILPFYNESRHVVQVLEELVKLPCLRQIICVDDGSTDDSVAKIIEHFPHLPQLQLIKLDKNVGKTDAVKTGLAQAKFETILLFDADLEHLRAEEVQASYQFFIDHQLDMLILGRTCPNPILRASRVEIVISGDRWLKKTDLETIFASFTFKRFALEAVINYYMQHQHKKLGWYQTTAQNTFKHRKYGFIEGLILSVKEAIEIFANNYNLFWQLISFRPPQIKN